MINKTEQDIMQNWQSDEMMVSITCVAFNHEDYMHTTLDSFLMQETTFPFEVLINDDVSTDSTIDILKEYEQKFPNIVKPLYQTENKFSQGINTMALLFPLVEGKYIAFCDGDDYWVDNQKLQIQVDAMELHPEVDLCIHSAYRETPDGARELVAKHANETKKFSVKNSILSHGDFSETASMMFTTSLIKSLPKWFDTAMPGDYVFEIIGANRGGSLYIDRTMSVYRADVEGGWTTNELKKSTEERRDFLYAFNDQITFLDEYLDKKYHTEFRHVFHGDVFDFICTVTNDIRVKKELYAQYQNKFSLIEKIQWHCLYKHQGLIELLKSIKDKRS